MTEFTKEWIEKVRLSSHLIEPPAAEVIGELLDEIQRLQTRIQEVETEGTTIMYGMAETIQQLKADRVEIKKIVDGIYNDVHFMPCVKNSIEMKVIRLAGVLDEYKSEEK